MWKKFTCNLRGLGTLGKVSLWQNWQTRLCIYVHPKADAYLRSWDYAPFFLITTKLRLVSFSLQTLSFYFLSVSEYKKQWVFSSTGLFLKFTVNQYSGFLALQGRSFLKFFKIFTLAFYIFKKNFFGKKNFFIAPFETY